MSSELASALAKAQGEMGGALKDRQNPHFKASYATMASVVDAVRGPMSRAGVAWVQTTEVSGRTVSVETVLMHGSGERLACGKLTAEAKDGGPQAIGSVLTYLRRYSLMAAVGVAPEDDDGETAERAAPPAPAPKPAPRPEPPRPDARAAAMAELEATNLEMYAVDRWLVETGKAKIADRDPAGLSALAKALSKPGRSGFDAWVISHEGAGE